MLGHAKVTMPDRQADLDQKSVCRKNQNKRPFPDHSAHRAVWAANNWNNLNGGGQPPIVLCHSNKAPESRKQHRNLEFLETSLFLPTNISFRFE
jgi:hypothetical protein